MFVLDDIRPSIYAFIECRTAGRVACFARVYLPYNRALYALLECENPERPDERINPHYRRKGCVPRDTSKEVVWAYTVSASDDEAWSPYARVWNEHLSIPSYFRGASWLTTDEFAERLDTFRARYPACPPLPEYDAALQAMKCLPEARIVFWLGPE